jgi:regulator of sigma E protease
MSFFAIILFIFILIVLVIVHEFGHFIAAKLTGMRVDEFAFGFPPRIFSKKIGETVYAFNAIPLGGYVSIWGENGSEEDKKENGAASNPRAFGNRPAWAQLIVLFAGVAMNMILALVIFVFISYGEVRISTDDPVYGSRVKNAELVVTDISKESPAFKAGVTPGSVITSITSAGKVADITSATSVLLRRIRILLS